MRRSAAAGLVSLTVAVAAVAAASPLAAQSSSTSGAANTGVAAPAARTRPADPTTTLTFDLDRIRRAVQRHPRLVLTLPEAAPMFRVDIEGRLPSIEAWIGDPKSLHRGPTVSSPYHSEFLNMVTPPEATASFTNTELLQVVITGLLGKLALHTATQALKNAASARRRGEACEEVRLTVVDLNRERERRGLLPVPLPDCY
jgi:hypothetical protein